jgi:hypothetical protein
VADKKVRIYSDKPVRWRIQGSQLWINLGGGQWNELPVFSGGERIEISSQLTVTVLKIHGDIKEVNIPNSELTNLNGSFEGTRNLNTVYLRSGATIDTMVDTFSSSGVVNFDIVTDGAVNLTGFAKNTFRLESAIMNVSNAVYKNNMFRESNLSSITSISGMTFQNSTNAFAYTKNLKRLGGAIDLRTEPNENMDSMSTVSSQWLNALYDISYLNGRIMQRKIYSEDVIDDTMNFEMSIKQKELDTSYTNSNIDFGSSGEAVNALFDFEMDMSQKELDTSYSKEMTELYGHNKITDTSVDPLQNFEMECHAVDTDASYKSSFPYSGKQSLDSVVYDPAKTFVFDMKSSIIEVKNSFSFESKKSFDILPIDGSKDFEFNISSRKLEIKKSLEFESKHSFDNTAIDVAQNFEFNIDASYTII